MSTDYLRRRMLTVSAMVFTVMALNIDVYAEADQFRNGFSSVAKMATPAVVFIKVEKDVPVRRMQQFGNMFDFFGDGSAQRFFSPNGRGNTQRPGVQQPQTYRQVGQGSGFIVSKDGYILTNTHVVGDMDKITVTLADGREFSAKRIGADPKTEVALIKIEADDLPYLKTGDVDKLETGDWVIAIGNPFGLNKTLTVGVVSAKGRTNIGITDYEDFIQTDAAINPGNSGGPLLNIDGEVIGINTAIYSQSGGYMGIGFAVPIDMALRIKDQLVANGYVKRGYMGVYLNPGEVTKEMATSFGYDQAGGVLIADVMENGPAEKAGIKRGDILIELESKKIKDNQSFRNDVARIMPNKDVKLALVRNGKRKKVTVRIGLMPGDDVSEETQVKLLDKIGFRLQELDAEIAAHLNYKDNQGLVVTDVQSGSEAQEKGLRVGMLILEVNRKEVTSLDDFYKAADNSKNGRMLLRVKVGNSTIFINLDIS